MVATDSSICNFSDTFRMQITTRDDFVIADFDTTILTNCDSLLTVNMTNQSQFATDYIWDFGDGSPQQTNQDPQHVYTVPGSYPITLVAIDTNRCHPRDTIIKTVTLLPNTVIDFVIADQACNGDDLLFQNLSNPTASYFWDFGDGTSSTDVSPIHSYANEGTYTINTLHGGSFDL